MIALLIVLAQQYAVRALQPSEVQYQIAQVYKKPAEPCFTQGILLDEDGSLVESCGLYGKSYIRKYKLAEGIPPIDKRMDVPKDVFLEGIALLGNTLWALTYRKRTVLRFDRESWEEQPSLSWKHPEGWGLATDGCTFFANNGGSEILHLDANGEETKQVTVKKNGVRVNKLNDMIYVAPKLWINVWLTDTILRVDPHTGIVEKKLSLKKLGVQWNSYTETGNNTPNGIVYDQRDAHALYVTGKLWKKVFTLKLSTVDLCGEVVKAGVCAHAPHTPCWQGAAATEGPDPMSTASPPAPDASGVFGWSGVLCVVVAVPIFCFLARKLRKRKNKKMKKRR